MPPISQLVAMAQEALILAMAVSLPVLAAAALTGLVVSMLQAATQVSDPTLSHLPRLLAVVAALAVSGSWMGSQIAAFAARVFSGG